MPRGVYERKTKKKTNFNNQTKGKPGYFLDPVSHRQKSKKKWPELWKKVKTKEIDVVIDLPQVVEVTPVKHHHNPLLEVRILLNHGEKSLMKSIKEGKVTEIDYDRCCAIMALRALEGKVPA